MGNDGIYTNGNVNVPKFKKEVPVRLGSILYISLRDSWIFDVRSIPITAFHYRYYSMAFLGMVFYGGGGGGWYVVSNLLALLNNISILIFSPIPTNSFILWEPPLYAILASLVWCIYSIECIGRICSQFWKWYVWKENWLISWSDVWRVCVSVCVCMCA